MKFVGSKNRLCKYIIPIIQEIIDDSNCDGYLEVCVGGANVIDKINHNNKIGSDIHKELIALLNYIKILNNPLPTTITEEEYKQVKNNKNNYPNWYIGLVGFCATYGSRYFQGFARGFKADKITPRDIPNEGIRNIEKQRKNLTDVKFYCKNFNEYTNEEINNYVIYCDIPYRSTKRYPEQPKFNYEEFYAWAKEMSKNNIIIISEYQMPENNFECIWSKEHKVGLDNKGTHKKSVEKLFIVKN